MRIYPHVIFFPAAAMFLTILTFNTLGNELRNRLDPNTNEQQNKVEACEMATVRWPRVSIVNDFV